MNNNTVKRLCTVIGCNNKHLAKGYCSKHYSRIRRYGNVNTVKQSKGIYDSCKVEGCKEKHSAKGYCSMHYKRWKRNGNPTKIIVNRNHNGVCEYVGCNNDYYAKGYCVKHYGRLLTHGDPSKVISRKIVGKCKVDNCVRLIYCKGYCNIHYQRIVRHGDPLKNFVNTEHNGKCSVEGCDGKFFAKEMCEKHYNRSYSKAYKRSERGKEVSRMSCQRRRARKRNAPINDFTLKQWKECLSYFDNKCAYCGTEKGTLNQEHNIPVSKGGSHTKTNVIPSCGNCNSSKGTRTIHEWYATYEHYDKKRKEKILKYLGYKVEGNIIQLQLF